MEGLTAADLLQVELLDTSEVAARLRLSSSRAVQLEREGRIPAARTVSGRRVFIGADVEGFRQQRAGSR
jgi:hypothetical protein